MGLEPTTSSLGSWHSTTELLPLAWLLLSINKTRELGNRGLREGGRRRLPEPGEEEARSALVSARERMQKRSSTPRWTPKRTSSRGRIPDSQAGRRKATFLKVDAPASGELGFLLLKRQGAIFSAHCCQTSNIRFVSDLLVRRGFLSRLVERVAAGVDSDRDSVARTGAQHPQPKAGTDEERLRFAVNHAVCRDATGALRRTTCFKAGSISYSLSEQSNGPSGESVTTQSLPAQGTLPSVGHSVPSLNTARCGQTPPSSRG